MDTTALAAAIPNVQAKPLGKPTPATAAIRDRILQKKDAQVPIAAFQSSI